MVTASPYTPNGLLSQLPLSNAQPYAINASSHTTFTVRAVAALAHKNSQHLHKPSQHLTRSFLHRNNECSQSVSVYLPVHLLDDYTTSPSLNTQGSLSCSEVSIAARSTSTHKPLAIQLARDFVHQTLASPKSRTLDSRQRFKLALKTLSHAYKYMSVECASPCK
jgi:hypothetical protein